MRMESKKVMQQNESHEITKVALDAMGGDNAPVEIIKGAIEAGRMVFLWRYELCGICIGM